MPTPNILNASIPQGVPFLSSDGSVSPAWLYYFVSLGIRTSMPAGSGGAAAGGTGISTSALFADITNLSVEVAMADVPDTTNTTITVTSGLTAGFLLSQAFEDAAVKPVLNPILAAFLVETVS